MVTATKPKQSIEKSMASSQPIVNITQDRISESPVIHMDETTVQVLKEKDNHAQKKRYMWVQRANPADTGETRLLVHKPVPICTALSKPSKPIRLNLITICVEC